MSIVSVLSKILRRATPPRLSFIFFYNNEVGKEAHEARGGHRSRLSSISAHKGEEAGAVPIYSNRLQEHFPRI